jgi:hypothetical protein
VYTAIDQHVARALAAAKVIVSDYLDANGDPV